MQLNELIHFFEKEYPLQLQEDYDNCGLQIGDTSLSIRGILVSLDCSEAVVTEAIEHNCNLIICHHPLSFIALRTWGKCWLSTMYSTFNSDSCERSPIVPLVGFANKPGVKVPIPSCRK